MKLSDEEKEMEEPEEEERPDEPPSKTPPPPNQSRNRGNVRRIERYAVVPGPGRCNGSC